MRKGRSLELYFIDGKPDGMLTAEVFNWTGHVLKFPRTKIVEALKRPEAGYTGIYILLGEANGEPRAYIGEGEELAARLRDHVAKKDWWETAVLVTSAADNLHKAHVKYLESRLVEMANATKRMPLENGNVPTRSSLSESGVANMEAFLDTLMIVLPAIQVDMFVNKAQRHQIVVNEILDLETPVFELKIKKDNLLATAEMREGEIVVLAGSQARNKWVGTASKDSGYHKLRNTLFMTQILGFNDTSAIFEENYAFSSPSAAAAVIAGRAANGRTAWKLKGTNKTYAEWEAEQLEKDD